MVTGYNGYPLIEGNTFYANRHAIAASAEPLTGYRAWYNLVLSAGPSYGIFNTHEQDFDMHGSDTSSHHTGGIGGGAVEIARNTFFATNRRNFDLRGKPCHLDQFHDNVSRQNKNDAIRWVVQGSDQASPPQPPPPWLDIPNNNQFGPSYSDPTQHLGVGDFDGDGREDLFLATGAAWYYAPAGKAEWRFLNSQTDGIGNLLFGDFDADGRTDVFAQHGFDWLVSWGGASAWEKINVFSQTPISEYAIGDFNGDHLADVFYADGKHWYVSYGGSTPFTLTADSSYRVPDLGFGDFNNDGKTDVVGVVSGQWMVSLSATGPWAGFPLRAALTKTMAGLIIADLNGNGHADIVSVTMTVSGFGSEATPIWNWKVSWDGKSDWKTLSTSSGSPPVVGRFDANPGSDILFYWTNDNHLGIQSSGVGAPQRYSTQHMR